ncbi:MAG: hypothetical protein DRO05_03625 [Thermoproteota archaeon]|nr:MAG: hypothetical protein DRO05_03625 [Candidatus Korarchaeota archaeon]
MKLTTKKGGMVMIILCIKHDGECPQCGTTLHPSQLNCPSCGADIRWYQGNPFLCAECAKEEAKKVVPKDHLLHQLNSSLNLIFKALTFCDQNRFGECTEEISRAINELRNVLETIENNEIVEK